MKRFLLGAACVTMLCGCGGTNLRRPLCSNDQMAFPPGSEGHYRLSMPTSDPAQSGTWTALTQMEFIIHEGSDAFELAAPKSTVARVPQLKRFFKRAQASGFVSDSDAVGYLVANVCNIGGVYYMQSEQDNGSFVMARFDLSSTGITVSDLMFPPARLKAAGIPYYFLPTFDQFDRDGHWRFDLSDPARMIVDNEGATNRERFMALAEPTSFGQVYSRISTVGILPSGAVAKDWVKVRLPK